MTFDAETPYLVVVMTLEMIFQYKMVLELSSDLWNDFYAISFVSSLARCLFSRFDSNSTQHLEISMQFDCTTQSHSTNPDLIVPVFKLYFVSIHIFRECVSGISLKFSRNTTY